MGVDAVQVATRGPSAAKTRGDDGPGRSSGRVRHAAIRTTCRRIARAFSTSGIVATRDGHRVALFVTGRRHAGENLARILAARTADLGPMCDALSRNLPKPLAVILGYCLPMPGGTSSR